jgi:hypothetical protein
MLLHKGVAGQIGDRIRVPEKCSSRRSMGELDRESKAVAEW